MSVTTEGATRRVTMSQVYVTGLACAMASVRQMSQVWHVSWRLCVRCHRFGMCHGVCASDVMASVRQMSCHVMLKLLLQFQLRAGKKADKEMLNIPGIALTVRFLFIL